MVATWQQIVQAVQKGVNWLIARQNADGSYGQWGPGSTCLAVMALVRHGVPSHHLAVKNAVSYILNSAPADNVYFRALTVMALVANGKQTPEIIARVQSDIEWLIAAQGSDEREMLSYGGWGFYRNPYPADGSNTQYAIAALNAAAAWGTDVPEGVWYRAARWYQRNHAINNDGSYTYGLGEYAQLTNNGIAYSMTAAALLSLKVINAFAIDPQVQIEVRSMIGHTLDWLNANYIIELSAGIPDSWYYYYLYTIANGCNIEPYTAFIGANDWYIDVADTLVALQQPDGKWTSELDKKSTDVVHTSFALLALARPKPPAYLRATDRGADQNVSHRISKARFPVIKTLADFDFKHITRINRPLIEQLGTGDFITRKENIVLIGNPGTGKTHLAISLGVLACARGFSVKFYTALDLVNQLLAAQAKRRYLQLASLLSKVDLLIIDELSYLTLSRPSAELLFQIISARNERASLIITSNLDFAQWTEIFGDPMLTAAVVDRMNHKAYIIDTHGPSYRPKQRLQPDR